jgi:hypothetical protein
MSAPKVDSFFVLADRARKTAGPRLSAQASGPASALHRLTGMAHLRTKIE